jgi:hypothetical protein
MRKRTGSGTLNIKAAEIISGIYDKLYRMCACSKSGMFEGAGNEDIFHDAILCTITDAAAPIENGELIKYFKNRYNMFHFQTVMDARELGKIEVMNESIIADRSDTQD